ncbi:MAG: prepilin peptidase [Fibrobacteres bacterium]|nr:prepilin peptidase [Fibrobacterota bacterium]
MTFQSAAIAITLVLLIPLIVIDIRKRLLPDYLTMPILAINLIASMLVGFSEFKESLLGALVGGGFFAATAIAGSVILKKEGMGGGDIKLMAALGAALGPLYVLPAIFCASLSALIFVLVRYPIRRKFIGETFPFGPFIAVGFAASLLFRRFPLL